MNTQIKSPSASAAHTPGPWSTDIDCVIANMVNAFLKWPLPESVCADGCATRQGEGRTGTNLLSIGETIQMMQQVVRPQIEEFFLDEKNAALADSHNQSQAQANARLIAAAPELLAALETAAEGLDFECANRAGMPFSRTIKDLAKARDAIAKARQ